MNETVILIITLGGSILLCCCFMCCYKDIQYCCERGFNNTDEHLNKVMPNDAA